MPSLFFPFPSAQQTAKCPETWHLAHFRHLAWHILSPLMWPSGPQLWQIMSPLSPGCLTLITVGGHIFRLDVCCFPCSSFFKGLFQSYILVSSILFFSSKSLIYSRPFYQLFSQIILQNGSKVTMSCLLSKASNELVSDLTVRESSRKTYRSYGKFSSNLKR